MGQKTREHVVLLHGMGRSRASLWIMQQRFERRGYQTTNFAYSPPLETLDEVADRLATQLHALARAGQTYHLIGHSLGNIIIRFAGYDGYPPGLGRIVMLAPPNRPAKLARFFQRNPLYRLCTGDSGQRLADPGFYASLPIPDAEVGVIAGTRGHSLTFDLPNDGVIQIESTFLDSMADWVAVHHSHTFLMNSRDTFEHALHFLNTGRFLSPEER